MSSAVEVLRAYPPREECNVFFQLPHADGIWQVNAHMRDVCRDMPDEEPNEWLQSARDQETKVVCFPQGRWTKEEFANGVAYLVKTEGLDFAGSDDIACLVSYLAFFSYLCHEFHIKELTNAMRECVETRPLNREEFLLVFHYAHPRKEKKLLGLLGYSALTTVYDEPIPDDVWASLGMDHVSEVASHVANGLHRELDKIIRTEGGSVAAIRHTMNHLSILVEAFAPVRKRKAQIDDDEPGSKRQLTE